MGENQRGKGEGQQGGGFPREPAEGPTIADLQRCWGFHAKSFSGIRLLLLVENDSHLMFDIS